MSRSFCPVVALLYFTCIWRTGEQDVCLFMCPTAGEQHVWIWTCPVMPGVQPVCIFTRPVESGELDVGILSWVREGPWLYPCIFTVVAARAWAVSRHFYVSRKIWGAGCMHPRTGSRIYAFVYVLGAFLCVPRSLGSRMYKFCRGSWKGLGCIPGCT